MRSAGSSQSTSTSRLATATRVLFATAMALCAALALLHATRLLSLLESTTVLPLLLGALLGITAADWLTGLIHWACDTWGDADTLWLGPGLIFSFREHHREPQKMLAHDAIEVNGEACAAATGFFFVLAIPAISAALEARPLLYAFAWSLASFAAIANQLHKWAHTRNPPVLVRVVQKTGLVLSLDRHAKHHRAPHTNGYCISIGWLNPVLDRLRFWRGLEHCVTFVTGVEPRTSTNAPRSRGHEVPREQGEPSRWG